MKPGTLCSVRQNAPLFPDPPDLPKLRPVPKSEADHSWKRGQQPINIDATTIGIILDSKLEPDIFEPRTFLRVSTRYGVGWVNSTFCREENEAKSNNCS